MRWLVLVVAACRFAPNDATSIDGAPGEQPDAAADATMAGPVPCANPIVDEPFTDTTACAPWANAFMNAGPVQQGGGAITITLDAFTVVASGCIAKTARALPAGGAIVEVPAVVQGGGTYTQLQVLEAESLSIGVNGSELRFADNSGLPVYAHVAYDPVAMRWWRLRAVAGGVAADYSADGGAWTPFGSHATTLADMRLQVIAGSNGGPNSGSTQFTRLVICP